MIIFLLFTILSTSCRSKKEVNCPSFDIEKNVTVPFLNNYSWLSLLKFNALKNVAKESINDLNNRLKNQKGIEVIFSEIKNSNHFFKGKEEELNKTIDKYIKDKTKLI